MDLVEAKALLRRHCDSGPEDDTLLGRLRPYRGLERRHVTEILHALLVAAPALNEPASVDRGLVHSLWDLCRTARAWTRGPHEPMFHGPRYIAPAEKRLLDSWIDEIESISLSLLRGQPAQFAFLGLSWYVVEWGLGSRAAFLVPLFQDMLRLYADDESDGDDEINLCRALGAIGAAAGAAVPLIAAVGQRSKYPGVREVAAEALRAIAEPGVAADGGLDNRIQA